MPFVNEFFGMEKQHENTRCHEPNEPRHPSRIFAFRHALNLEEMARKIQHHYGDAMLREAAKPMGETPLNFSCFDAESERI
jgi:hypothetical protein